MILYRRCFRYYAHGEDVGKKRVMEWMERCVVLVISLWCIEDTKKAA